MGFSGEGWNLAAVVGARRSFLVQRALDFEDRDGTIWAGLLTGMARLKNNQIRNITRVNGLFDDFIFAIIPDDFGYFWVDSMRGIFRVSRQSLNDFCDGKTDQVKCEAYDGLEMVKRLAKRIRNGSAAKPGMAGSGFRAPKAW